jgi:hypothetical protein
MKELDADKYNLRFGDNIGGHPHTYPLDAEVFAMLQNGIDEGSPNFDVTMGGRYENYDEEHTPEHWNWM